MAAALRQPLIPSHAATLIPHPTPLSFPSPFLITPKHSTRFKATLLVLLRPHPFLTRSAAQDFISIPRPISVGPLPCFQALGFNDREAEALLEKHPALALASPEHLHRRIDSLRSTGLSNLALRRPVAKRPEILTSSFVEPFLDFVRHELQGFNPTKLERLLASADLRFLARLGAKVRLLVDHGVPRDKLAHVLNKVDVRKVFGERSSEEIEEAIKFLKCYGLQELIVRRPTLMNLDLHTQLIPRVEFFIELGGGDVEAAALLINKLPAILSYTVEHLRSHAEFWSSVGLTRLEFFRIAQVCPNVVSVSRERKLQPRIEFLKQCGLDAEDISKFLIKAPLFLSLSFKSNLSKKLTFLVKIGYRHQTRALALAMGAATRTSCENMQMVVGVFFRHGLSCEDVLAMSQKHPQVLQYNHVSLERKMEFLIQEMGREVGELLTFPAFLGYKLDDRIKYRYEVKKDVRGKGMSLNKLLAVSARKFYTGKESRQVQCNHTLETVES